MGKVFNGFLVGLAFLIGVYMLHLIKTIRPCSIDGVACSGGVDSMVLLNYLSSSRRYKKDSSHPLKVFFYHHNTETSEEAFKFLSDYCSINKLEMIYSRLLEDVPKGRSHEDYWREKRYCFLNSYSKMTIATAHHLNDAVETWLFSSFHGCGKLIPVKNKNIVRPLLLSSKEEILNYSVRHNVPYIEDLTNNNTIYSRNRIRHNILPEVLKINPGIMKVIKKRYLFSSEDSVIV